MLTTQHKAYELPTSDKNLELYESLVKVNDEYPFCKLDLETGGKILAFVIKEILKML